MKRFAVVLSLVIGVWVLSPTPQAHASWFGDIISWLSGGQNNQRGQSGKHRWKGKNGKKPAKASVPELDPNAAGGAMILLLGGVAYIASRRRDEDLV